MGCFVSTPNDGGGNRRTPGSIGEVAVFVPGLRIPKAVDFSLPLGDQLPKSLLEHLSALRTRVVVMAAEEGPAAIKRRKAATQHGGSTLADLQQALEDYLPGLMGLVKDGTNLKSMVHFVWVNQEDEAEEISISNVWYEILSVLHLMAMLSLSQANLVLLPKTSADGYQAKLVEESRRASVDIFLKAAGYLECAVTHVLPQIPTEVRRALPIDLAEGVLQALCQQALGQGVEMQLGMAIGSTKATLAVKRRLACEMVKYWNQAHENLVRLSLRNDWGEKHQLFVRWKHIEAKAAAYYYHGLILDEGNTEQLHSMAVAALQAADDFLKESKRACEAFNTVPPTSRCPPLWGAMKYLAEKIPKDASSQVRINRDLYSQENRVAQKAPELPDFALALKPDEYHLPPLDPCWNSVDDNVSRSREQLKPEITWK